MSTYNYNLISDFGGNLNIRQFRQQIIDDVTITTVLTSISIISDSNGVAILFPTALSAPEVTALDNLVTNYSYTAPSTTKIIFINDQKISGQDGGTFTAGSWQTRDLNTITSGVEDIVTLTSNQLTIFPGKYQLKMSAPASQVNHHQICLYNVTDDVIDTLGTSEFASTLTIGNSSSCIETTLILTEKKVFELRHQCSFTQSELGFGLASGFGELEVYSNIRLSILR